MKKKVEEKKLFQKQTYPRRYFVINFSMAVLKISNKIPDTVGDYYDTREKNGSVLKVAVIPFREIEEAWLPKPSDEVTL